MGKKKKRKSAGKKKISHIEELTGLVLLIVGILSITPTPLGAIGALGASFAMFLVGTSYQILLMFIIVLGCYLIIKREYPNFFTTRLVGIYVFAVGILVLSHLNFVTENSNDVMMVIKDTVDNLLINFSAVIKGNPLSLKGAGVIGAMFSITFFKLFALQGTYIVSAILIAVGVFLLTGFNLIDFIKNIKIKRKEEKIEKKLSNTMANVIVNDSTEEKEVKPNNDDKKIKIHDISELTKVKDQTLPEGTKDVVVEPENKVSNVNYNYKLPPLDFITRTKKTKGGNNNQVIEANIEKLEKVLLDFGIKGKVVEVNVGPSVTQYELEITSGTKMAKITGLNKEISLALAKKDVRIQAPIPGKSTVGIELANDSIMAVGLREILESDRASKSNNKLLACLGKDIMGKSICCDIDKTPHMLVAGSTGSGKSVCINCIIASILMRAKPNEVKLVLVDPKKVEFSMYNGIPHLLIPVVTDPKKANDALKRIVREMEDRYDIFANKNVKNIASYNAWVDKQNEGKSEEEKMRHMNYIVVIIDELADLMLVAAKEVEDSIMRITQMARAAGIHLIVATQRPSTDVITGVVKANIPSRISFAVSSSIDSRTILDMTGAEKLLGRGDMLFLPMGENSPTRVQGAYVSDEDLEKIVNHTISQQKAEYDERFMNLGESNSSDRPGMEEVRDAQEEYDDPLYNEIVEFVITSGKASASLLQRRFKLGYNRAARIIDLLEERGIIGPQNGSKPREVLVKLEESNDYEE